MDPITGEALLAAIGVDAVLGSDAVRISAEHRRAAAKLSDPEAMEREIKRFLNADEFESPAEMPSFDYDEVLERLTDSVSAEQLESVVRGNDPDEAMLLIMAAGKAFEFLGGIMPRRTRMTIVGPRPVPPSDMDVARFKRTYAVVQRPMSLLEDLAAGCLTTEQVKAFEAVYPALYDVLKQAVMGALIDRVAASRDWEPRPRANRMLQILMQTRTVDQAALKALQGGFVDGVDETTEKPPSRPLKSGADRVETNTQRTALK